MAIDPRTDEIHQLFAKIFGDNEAEHDDAMIVLATTAYLALLDIADAQRRLAASAEYENKRPS